MKPQSVDNSILFNIFGGKNKISKLLISVGIHCKQGKGVLNWENGLSWSSSSHKVLLWEGHLSTKEIHDDFIKTLGDESPYRMVKKWAAEFRRGRESVDDYEWSGHP